MIIFLYYFIFSLTIGLVFYAYFNDLRKGYFAASFCFCLFCIINYFKIKITGVSFKISDIMFIFHINDILYFTKQEDKIKMIVSFIFVILILIYVCFKKPKKQYKISNKKRIFISIILLLIILGNKDKPNKLTEQILKPSPKNKPNVIVVMSEAFWDPTLLKKFVFSKDPIKNYRDLIKNNITGNIISPVVGGVTCNVEYEFLTGRSIFFVDKMDVPFESYKKYINKTDYMAIPWQFKNNGYKTIAVHPYNKFFYNRNLIYPRLGFDEFLSISDICISDMESQKGQYISDEYFIKTIIKTIDNSDEPLFVFGISIENHYPYSPKKFDTKDISFIKGELPNVSLECYTQGVYNADKSLKQLVDYLETQKEPTLLFFFGDHLPLIDAKPLKFYSDAGFISTSNPQNWSLDDIKKMHSTPYVLWANYELPKTKLNDFSPIYIGPILLDLANLNKNKYSSYLTEMQKRIPVLHRDIVIDNDGNAIGGITDDKKNKKNN